MESAPTGLKTVRKGMIRALIPKSILDADVKNVVRIVENLDSNDKRKTSCKAVGSEKKLTGHKREDMFGASFCDPTATTYKAEADKTITNSELLTRLQREIGPLRSGATSIKSGKNLQFTLGRIPEITDADDKCVAIAERKVWEKYLGKSHSNRPADILCYRRNSSWVFFNMDDVITFICTRATWRTLESGRIKGNFADCSRAGSSQYLTYEYRRTHGSHFLGANGNKGEPFIALLMANLRHTEVEDTQ